MSPDSHLVWQRVPPLNAKDPLVEWTATTAGALLRLPRADEATEFHLYPWLVQGSPFTPWSGDPRGISCYRRGRQITAEEVEQLEAQPYESEEEARALLRSHGVSDEFLATATRIRVPPYIHESPMKTKPCKDCGNQVSRRAKTCPACGAPTVSRAKAGLVGCLALVVLAVALASLLPEVEDTGSEPAAGRPATNSTPAPAAPVAAMGETVSPGYMSYRVESAQWTSRLSANEFLNEPPAAMYLVVSLTARNNDTKARQIPPFTLVDDRGAEHEPAAAGWAIERAFGVLESLNPGVQKAGRVVFDVPRERTYSLKLSGGFWSADKALVALEADEVP